MFRFTIRDVLWLTVVVALGIVLGVQHQKASAARKRALAALDHLATVDFVEMPLSEATLYLSAKQGIPVFLADDADGLKPVTCQLSDISLRSALDLMLPPLDMDYRVEDGWILIEPRRH